MWTVAASMWEDLVDPLKVTFDTANRHIIVNPQYSDVDMKIDVYSAYKRWWQRRDNAKYPPPLRTTGGDPVGAGLYSGDMYFLVNNWQMVTSTLVNVNGILYQDNPLLDTYVILPGGGVRATVSSLAYAYTTSGVTVPSAAEISAEVWNAQLAVHNTVGTTGAALSNVNSQTVNVSSEFQNVNMKLNSLPIGVSAQVMVDLQDEITAINTIPSLHTAVANVAADVRTELTAELTHLSTLQNGMGLDSTQATMLLEIYRLYGLDPTMPLVVTDTSRTVGPIDQTIHITNNSTTVTRV